MDLRAGVVSLIVDADLAVRSIMDIDWGAPFEGDNVLVHHDGAPFTAEEMRSVGSATRAELEAVSRYLHTAQECRVSQLKDYERMLELAGPYMTRLGEGATMGEVREIMPAPERAELDELAERLAPGGVLV